MTDEGGDQPERPAQVPQDGQANEEIVQLEPGPDVLNMRLETGFAPLEPGLSEWLASKIQQSRDDK